MAAAGRIQVGAAIETVRQPGELGIAVQLRGDGDQPRIGREARDHAPLVGAQVVAEPLPVMPLEAGLANQPMASATSTG